MFAFKGFFGGWNHEVMEVSFRLRFFQWSFCDGFRLQPLNFSWGIVTNEVFRLINWMTNSWTCQHENRMLKQIRKPWQMYWTVNKNKHKKNTNNSINWWSITYLDQLRVSRLPFVWEAHFNLSCIIEVHKHTQTTNIHTVIISQTKVGGLKASLEVGANFRT